MTKPEFPSDLFGSLLIDAWTERYNAEGGKGSVYLWALEHAKTEVMVQMLKKAFLGSRTYTLVGEKWVECEITR